MNAAQMPGMGDEITWGAVMHPNDPRQPEPGDDDGALDSLADQRDDYAMRALVDEVFNEVICGRMTPEEASDKLDAAGVPFEVQCRVLIGATKEIAA